MMKAEGDSGECFRFSATNTKCGCAPNDIRMHTRTHTGGNRQSATNPCSLLKMVDEMFSITP